jgi:glycosyltransferase involved in cell wall biosynthesis
VRILIVTTQVPFVRGGAEVLADGLRDALEAAGHEAEIVRFPFKWYPADAIAPQVLAARLLDLSEFSGNRIDRVIGLKFPAYLVPHPRKFLWIVHQHRSAYDFWESGHSDFSSMPQGRAVRDLIREADQRFIPEAQAVHTISANVSARLWRYNHIASSPLYHPPANAEAYSGRFDDYFFYPSRIDPMKRQALVIDALAASSLPMHVVFAGNPDNAATLQHLRARASDSASRIASHGRDDRRVAQDRAIRECLRCRLSADRRGLRHVTLEAMLAGRPVVTCADSGGPLGVRRGWRQWRSRAPVAESAYAPWNASGRTGRMRARWATRRESYERLGISWRRVVETLCEGRPS